MVRKSNSKRLQIYTQVKKRKIRTNHSLDLMDKVEKIIPEDKLPLLYERARKWFHFWGTVCSKLHLVPYSFMPGGKLRIFSGGQLLIHRAVLSMLVLSLVHKMAALCYRIGGTDSGMMNISKFMCIALVLVYFVTLSIAASVLFRREETVCILNAWDGLSASLGFENGNGGAFQSTKAALVIVSMSELCLVAGFGASFIGFAFDALPVSYFAAAESLGLLDTAVIPRFLWKFVFWPLELVTYMAPLLLGGWCGMINQLLPLAMSSWVNQLRQRTLATWEDNLALWKDYERLEIFHLVAARYTRFFLTPTLFSCSVFVIIAFYVCIRDVGLEWWLYDLFVSTSVTIFLMIFWVSYQLVKVVRASEEIVGVLTSTPDTYFGAFCPDERRYLARKARATRALGYRMGDFGRFTLDVPVVMWEEIWNQLLFLLSL